MSTRVKEFVEFHSYCCWNDSIVAQLKTYADLRNLSAEQREWLVLFYGLSYSIPSAIVCFENLQQIKTAPQQFWNENKTRLIFQSDRRWVKFNNQFVKSVIDFKQKRIFAPRDPFGSCKARQVEQKGAVLLVKNDGGAPPRPSPRVRWSPRPL